MIGTIDRLVLGPRPLIVDFKSNRTVPGRVEEVPEGILRQMGAYRLMVGQALAEADCAILWTETGQLMPLPGALVDAALARAGHELSATPLSQDVVDLDLTAPAS